MKYDPLADHLREFVGDRWPASFREIEGVLGFHLPASARKYPAWWANQTGEGHTQTAAWRDAGWQTCNLDLAGQRVEFQRVRASAQKQTKPVPSPANDDSLFRMAAVYTGIKDRHELTREALRALISREAARRLARAGGTAPDFVAPPRRREDDR